MMGYCGRWPMMGIGMLLWGLAAVFGLAIVIALLVGGMPWSQNRERGDDSPPRVPIPTDGPEAKTYR